MGKTYTPSQVADSNAAGRRLEKRYPEGYLGAWSDLSKDGILQSTGEPISFRFGSCLGHPPIERKVRIRP